MRTIKQTVVVERKGTIINTEDFLHFLHSNNVLNRWIMENAKSCFFYVCPNPITYRLQVIKTRVGVRDFIKGAFIWPKDKIDFWTKIDKAWQAFCDENNVVDFE